METHTLDLKNEDIMRPDSGQVKQSGGGLSTLAMTVLGLPLNKTMQLSDWEERPLSDSQIAYAACDAYVLLAIWNKIQSVDSYSCYEEQ